MKIPFAMQIQTSRITPLPNLPTHHLLPPVLLHSQDLEHANEDVQEVQLEADTLIDSIFLHQAALSQTCVVENLLHIVESEATEDGESSVQPDVLGHGEGAGGGCGEDERGEAGDGDEGHTGEEGTAEVEVFLLLGGGADEGDGSHHGDGVETGAGDESGWEHEEQGRDDGGLGDVEGGPEGVLLNIAIEC